MNVHQPADRPTDRPSAPQAHQYKISLSTGMTTQMQRKKRKKQQQNRVFFDVIFYVYTHVDNRERARETNFFRVKKNMKIS